MSDATPSRIVVVGASLAGLRAIEELRRGGYEGELVAIGDEPHLPYDRPPLSKQFLAGSWEEDKLALRKDGVDELAVTWRLGERASGLDLSTREVSLESGDRVGFDRLLIATGCAPRALPFGEGLEGIHLLRSLDDSIALRKALEKQPRVVVVGGGFIGMEVAATCRQAGLDVTVVEPLEAPMVRGLGAELGRWAADRHREHGVDVRCGVGVSDFEGSGRVERVVLSNGEKLDADVVVVGVGAKPNTGWLEGSGLDLTDGVLCDASGATGAEGVFAAGDVARWQNALFPEPVRLEHWTSAVEQGVHAARRMLDPATGPLEHVPYVWTDQFELRLQIAGHAQAGDEMYVGQGSLEELRFVALFGRNGHLTAAVANKRPRQLLAVRRLLGGGATFTEAIEAIG